MRETVITDKDQAWSANPQEDHSWERNCLRQTDWLMDYCVLDPPHEIRGSSNPGWRQGSSASNNRNKMGCSALLTEVGALTICSFKGEPKEVGIIVPTSQKMRLRFAEAMGTSATVTQVSGCKNNPSPFYKRPRFVTDCWRRDGSLS